MKVIIRIFDKIRRKIIMLPTKVRHRWRTGSQKYTSLGRINTKTGRLTGVNAKAYWSLDLTLATILYETLSTFADRTVSIPMGFTEEEWKTKVRELAKPFEKYAKTIDEIKPGNFEEHNRLMRDLKDGFEELASYFDDLWI